MQSLNFEGFISSLFCADSEDQAFLSGQLYNYSLIPRSNNCGRLGAGLTSCPGVVTADTCCGEYNDAGGSVRSFQTAEGRHSASPRVFTSPACLLRTSEATSSRGVGGVTRGEIRAVQLRARLVRAPLPVLIEASAD